MPVQTSEKGKLTIHHDGLWLLVDGSFAEQLEQIAAAAWP
jgi:hypothetical protein